jgi:hypothetical protein
VANVIDRLQRPTHRVGSQQDAGGAVVRRVQRVFPDNAVEYFVSYYDYYQPEAYVPSSDTFIEKDASINDQIEQHAAVGDQGIARAAGRHHRRDRVVDLRLRVIRRRICRWSCTSRVGERMDQRQDPAPAGRDAVHAQ